MLPNIARNTTIDKFKKPSKDKRQTTKQKTTRLSYYNLVKRKRNTFFSFFIGSGMSKLVC